MFINKRILDQMCKNNENTNIKSIKDFFAVRNYE